MLKNFVIINMYFRIQIFFTENMTQKVREYLLSGDHNIINQSTILKSIYKLNIQKYIFYNMHGSHKKINYKKKEYKRKKKKNAQSV